MKTELTSVERIAVSPALGRELGIVGGGVSRRIIVSVLSAASVLWPALFFGLPAKQRISPGDAALVATVVVAGMLVLGALLAWRWRHRIAGEQFVIRDRGRFQTGGGTKAWLSGDANDRWILVSTGHLRIDKDDNERSLEDAWVRLRRSADDRWEIDHTPHRFLLSVRDPEGRIVFARAGYVPPVGNADRRPMSDPEIRSLSDATWSRALRPLVLAAGCLIGGAALLVMGANAGLFPEGSPLTMVAVVMLIGLFAVSLFLLALGAFRTLALAFQKAARSVQRIQR